MWIWIEEQFDLKVMNQQTIIIVLFSNCVAVDSATVDKNDQACSGN